MLRVSNYEIQYCYKLSDVLEYGLNELGYSAKYPQADSTAFTRALFTKYGLAFPSSSLIPTNYIDDNHLGIINRVIETYWDEYVFECEEELTNNLQILSSTEVLYLTRRFLGKFMSVIENTWQKYTSILKAYETSKNDLLSKLQRISNGADVRRDNDTPQDTGDWADDTHTSFISQGTTDVTESYDDTSIIERLDKIQRLFQKTMLSWIREFKDLFVEGGNIHEIQRCI